MLMKQLLLPTTRSTRTLPFGAATGAEVFVVIVSVIVAVMVFVTTIAAAPVQAADRPAAACRVVPTSPEHRSLAGPEADVERLYRALFLRRPDDQGLRYWSEVLRRGEADLGDVADHFASSTEFTNRYGHLADDAFVDLLYCNVLGRSDGRAGAAYWRSELAGGLSRADAVLLFSQSSEFERRSTAIAPQPEPEPAPRTPSPSTIPTTTPSTSPATVPAPATPTTPTTPTTTPPPPDGNDRGSQPRLVWADEFDSFDPLVWRAEHSTYGDGNGELQCYRPENVSVGDGALVLRAKTETYTCPNGSTREVTSGMVRGRVEFDHGQRIEFRVKINPADPDDQHGLWPALWASSWNGGGWPRGGEVDWLEYVGKEPTRAHHTIHYLGTDGRRAKVPKAVELGERFSDSWHVIAFDWTDDLVWYLDGREVQRIRAAEVSATDNPFLDSADAITQIKLNLALGGSWGGPLGPTTLDATGSTNFAVDYVRIYDLP